MGNNYYAPLLIVIVIDSKELSIPIQQNVPHLVLPGHRSIVNQTRYSKTHHVLVTSGVEKLIKVKISL